MRKFITQSHKLLSACAIKSYINETLQFTHTPTPPLFPIESILAMIPILFDVAKQYDLELTNDEALATYLGLLGC